MTYDKIMRLPFFAWVLTCGVMEASGLIHYMSGVRLDMEHAVHILSRVSTITFMLLLATAAIARTAPSAKAEGLEPRISALAGTFLMYSMVLFPRLDLPLSAAIAATLLTTIGTIAAIIALSQLSQSFSIMAESRELVTTGPYKWVRHPLYLAEEIAIAGVFIQYASVWTALIYATQIGFQLRRIHNEEAVLKASFPAYETYERNTARLIPGVY